MILSKIISLNDDDSYQRWNVPDHSSAKETSRFVSGFSQIDNHDQASNQSISPQSASEFPGFDNAMAEGQSPEAIDNTEEINSESPYQAQADKFDTLLQAMTNPLQRVNAAVERELVELSLAIAKLILRREISQKPEELLELAKEAIKQLPAASLNIAVHLHPKDAAVVGEILQSTGKSLKWVLEEDPALNQGDCHIVTDTSFIDAGVDGLVERIAQEMLGSYTVSDFSETEPDEPS